MSFEPFKFQYTPPPTVPEPNRSQAAATAVSGTSPSANNLTSRSRAGSIIDALDGLIATSEYLQSVVLSLTKGMVVNIDPDVDPDASRALTGIYGQNKPNVITVEMFNHLLDADIGTMQLEMGAGKNSPIEANPVTADQFALLSRRVEKHLLNDGSYLAQLPIMLRTYKGDAAIFAQWKEALAKYPVVRSGRSGQSSISTLPSTLPAKSAVLSVSSVDMGDIPFNYLNDYTTRMSSVYGAEFSLITGIGHVERDISNVVNTYFVEPLSNLVRLVGAFNALRSFVHKARLSDLADDLTNFVYVRLASEVGSFTFQLDRLVQMAFDPLRSSFSAISSLVGQLSSVERLVVGIAGAAGEGSTGVLQSGGLKGLFSNNPCSGDNPTAGIGLGIGGISSSSAPGLDTVSEGLQILGQHLSWAQDEVTRRIDGVNRNFQRLMERRLKVHGDRLDLMCSLQSLGTLINLAHGFTTEFKNGGSGTGLPPPQSLETLNRILFNVQSAASTSFALQGNEILITPPDIPAIPDAVQASLQRGGLTTFRSPAGTPIRGALLNA